MTDSLDTNLILRCILGDNEKQQRSIVHFLNQSNHLHQIADIAVSEAVYVMETSYNFDRPKVVNHLTAFFDQYSPVLDYNQAIFAQTFPLYLAHPKLSFNDCYLSAYAEVHHAEPLFTFDKKLAAQADNAKLLK